MEETVAALDQLDADSQQRVEFLTTYHDQASYYCVRVSFQT